VKVGDRVRVVNIINGAPKETLGQEGILKDITDFDDYISCRVDFGDDWWQYAGQELELIPTGGIIDESCGIIPDTDGLILPYDSKCLADCQTWYPGGKLFASHGARPRKTRGFEAVTGYSPVLPKRSTAKSAGYDISVIGEAIVQPGQTVVFNTGLKAYMQDDEVLQIHIRSSVGIKRNLVLSNGTGIIDADFYNNPDNEGHIRIAVTNIGNEPQLVNGGKPIAQGIFVKYLTTDDDCADRERLGGIGSTDEIN
jgi:dUTP pyrophosphatase